MRTGISFTFSPDRPRLEAVISNRNMAQKHVWRAAIVLLSAVERGHQALDSIRQFPVCPMRPVAQCKTPSLDAGDAHKPRVLAIM